MDFNGLMESPRDSALVVGYLHGVHILRVLSHESVRLTESAKVTVWMESDENEDLEADATAFFDQECRRWALEFDYSQLRHVRVVERKGEPALLCFSCRQTVPELTRASSYDALGPCPHCGARLSRPLDPPDESV